MEKYDLTLFSFVAIVAIVAMISLNYSPVEIDDDALTGASITSLTGMAVACPDGTQCGDDQQCQVTGRKCIKKRAGRCRKYEDRYGCLPKQQPASQPQAAQPSQSSPETQSPSSPLPPQDKTGSVSSGQTCTDSDGGKNPDVAGSTSYAFGEGASRTMGSLADNCISVSMLEEGYCDGDRGRTENIDCGSGKICQAGACVVSTQPPCTDSDNGQDFKTPGKATYLNIVNGKTETSEDSCLADGRVNEFYCENGNVKSISTQCGPSEKCRTGACVDAAVISGTCTEHKDCSYPSEACINRKCAALSSLCSDTDGGNADTVQGTLTSTDYMTGQKTTVTDTCVHSTMLTEYYCNPRWMQGKKGKEFPITYDSTTVDCATKGGPCKDGMCVYTAGAKSAEGGRCGSDTDCQTGLKCNTQYYFCERVKVGERGSCQQTEDCAAGLVCDSGMCQKVTCTDSDNGMNPPDKGGILTITTTRMGTYKLPDTCVDDTTVAEQVCDLNNFLYFQKKPVKCPPEKPQCHDGVCGEKQKVAKYCNDGDGDYPFAKAIVRYNDDTGKEVEFWDRCVDEETVIEGKCDAQGNNFLCLDPNACKKKCDAGFLCKDGACTKSSESCDDSDISYADRSRGDDVDLRQKGTVKYQDRKGNSGSFVDSCASSASVTEGFCDGLVFKSTPVNCPQGTLCKEGACSPFTPSCIDTDGSNLSIVGTITYVDTKGEHKESDSCFSGTLVDEKVCVGVLPSTNTVSCPPSSKCVNGACVNPVVTTTPTTPTPTTAQPAPPSAFIQCGTTQCNAATQACKQVGEKCTRYRRTWRGRQCVKRESVYQCVAK